MEELIVKYWPQIGALVLAVGAAATLKADTRYMRKELDQHAKNSKEGFDGVNTKLDKHSEILGEHGERLTRLEK